VWMRLWTGMAVLVPCLVVISHGCGPALARV